MTSQQQKSVILSSVYLFLALLLIGFFLYLKFIVLARLEASVLQEKSQVESIKVDQGKMLSVELRETFERYSQGISGVESIRIAREEVFTGLLEEEKYEPVMLLPYLSFFQDFQKLLKKTSVISALSIDPVGKISFVVSTTSYTQAATQMAALRDGFKPTKKESQRPALFQKLLISSISKKDLLGKADEIPEVLREQSSVYTFLVQGFINPEYYLSLLEKAS